MGKKKKFTTEDFKTYIDNYTKENIADASRRFSIISGVNRNVARHIPVVFDGLKPVTRRILLVMYESKTNKFQKVNKVAGDAMGKYHPHGDASISDVISKMGQDWNNNITYIETQGNFGNRQGDDAASGRYTECKLSKFAYKCFFEDYKYASLDTKMSYTGNDEEPDYLPSKYPIGLVNPQFSSIGYGTAANIPPFNFTEVLEATIKLIKDPDSRINLIPDFPSGCDVIANNDLVEVEKTGIGKVLVKASTDIDYNRNIIHITSLPLQIGTKAVAYNISNLVLVKKTEGIADIKDYTDPEVGVLLDIHLKPSVNPDKILEELMKKDVGLKKTFSIQIKFIDDYQEYDYSPKEFLLTWLDFRREILQSMYNNKYVKLLEEQHMNNVKLFVFNKDNLNQTVDICRKASSTNDAIEKLMKKYKDSEVGMTSMQAKTIQGMRFSDFNKESYNGFLKLKEELKASIKETELILSNTSKIDEIIEKELLEGISLFGTKRRSKIVHNKPDKKEIIDKSKVLVAVSKDGYIKKINTKEHKTIGSLGTQSSRQVILAETRNDKNILIFDSTGKCTKIPVLSIHESTPEENGVMIERFFKVSGNVVAVMEEITDKELSKDLLITFFTKKGFSKRTSCKEFYNMKDNKTAISIMEDDELVAVINTLKDSSKDIIIYTDKGDGIRLDINDIKIQGASTRGLNMINLTDEEFVVGVDKIETNKKLLVFITSMGRVKVSELKYLPPMSRKDGSVSLINLNNNEYLVGLASVNNKNTLTVFRKFGDPVDIKIEDIKPSMRIAKGEKLVKTPSGDIVVGFRII